MSLEKLEFARSWENSADFPTFEENETKVREDMQYHPNAIRDFINGLIDRLESEGVLEITRTDGSTMKYVRLNEDKVLETSVDGKHWEATGSSGHVILDAEGHRLPQRSRMQFVNGTVTDENGVTVITGVKGDRGEQGEKGEKGDTGDTGPRGFTGPSIVPYVDIDGVMHFSVQDTATAPQSVSVRGPQGVQGVQGAQGEQGVRGPQGVQGVQGVQGPVGPQGERGPAGVAGAQGPVGPQGERGLDGADGRSFVLQDVFETLGALKSAYPTGNEFAYQVISEGRDVFIWSELAGDWVSVGQLQGPVGPVGPQGAIGPEGPAGPEGPQGVQGVQGPQGVIGPEGPQGPAGVAGKDGQSAYGAASANGYTGTETAFNNALVALPGHISDKNNPHGVTAEQVGAVNKSGDTMKGNLVIKTASLPAFELSSTAQGLSRIVKNASLTADYGTQVTDFDASGNSVALSLRGSRWETQKEVAALTFRNADKTIVNTYDILHTGNKDLIAPTDIGAFPKTGGLVDGSVTIDGNLSLQKVDNGYARLNKNHSAEKDYGFTIYDFDSAGNSLGLNLQATSQQAQLIGTTGTFKLLHEGNIADYLGSQSGAKIATGSYVGTGTYGEDNPCTLTFDFEPKFVFLHDGNGAFAFSDGYTGSGAVMKGGNFMWSVGQTSYTIDSPGADLVFMQNGKSLSWYADGDGARQSEQCNVSGETYYYFAIG